MSMVGPPGMADDLKPCRGTLTYIGSREHIQLDPVAPLDAEWINTDEIETGHYEHMRVITPEKSVPIW